MSAMKSKSKSAKKALKKSSRPKPSQKRSPKAKAVRKTAAQVRTVKRAAVRASVAAKAKAKLQKEMRKPRLLETPPTTDAPPPMVDSRPVHKPVPVEPLPVTTDSIEYGEELAVAHDNIATSLRSNGYRFVPGIPPVALHITPPDPALPQDGTLVRGQLCTWWGDMALTGTDPAGNAVCPQCGNGLQYLPDRAGVEAAAASFEAGRYPQRNVEQGALPKPHPGYVNFVKWMEGKCFPNITDAAATYVLASGIVVDPQP